MWPDRGISPVAAEAFKHPRIGCLAGESPEQHAPAASFTFSMHPTDQRSLSVRVESVPRFS